MAVLKSSLDDTIITRQERAVLREIFHIGQLSEGLKTLESVSISPTSGSALSSSDVEKERKQVSEYLTNRMLTLLENIRIPNSPNVSEK